MGQRPAQVLAEASADLVRRKARGLSRLASNSCSDSASRKVSSFTALPWASSPTSTKSRVLVTSTSLYRPQ